MKVQISSRNKTTSLILKEDRVWGILPDKILHFFSLRPGQEVQLEAEVADNLEKEVKKYAWQRLLQFLAYRERSRSEVLRFLKNLPLADTVATDIVIKAEELHYLDDERCTEILISEMMERGKSKSEIRGKIFQKGIDKNLASIILDRLYTLEQSRNLLKQALEKAKQKYRSGNPAEDKKKILSYLYRKGFAVSEISELMEREE
ncbi:MAG: RecX family transcriptional regulator [Candidatus Cloacimonetes bacterium]|nr:RecX family transcriptional regulator [Candidatus Cloacimonadota bacterium]